MFCHKCGIEIDGDAIFCKICGSPQNQIINPKEKNIKSSFPNSLRYALETSEPKQLLERFEKHLKTGVKGYEYKMFPDIWDILFSKMFISPIDLIDAMRCGTHKLREEDVHMLRLFIKEDCMKGGRFVQTVIQKGGMIDRAALIMIADPHDLARIEYDGTTPIHQLAVVCDKVIRPVLIRTFGKQLLSTLYDHNGMPALFLIFGRGDLRIHDLDAIRDVFSKNELKKVKVKNGRGRDGFEIFDEIYRSINSKVILERLLDATIPAEKKTDEEPDVRPHINSPIKNECVSPPPMEILSCKDLEPEKILLPHVTEISGPEMPELKENPDSSLTIMIVEDDEIIRQLLKIRLQILGYNKLFEAENGEQAVKLNQEIMADIIFMDINMPGEIDGIDAAREIKTHSKSRIIFLSAYNDPKIIDRAKEIQPDGFILKPFSATDLRVTLKLIQ